MDGELICYAETYFKYNKEVTGHLTYLDDTRLVFLGKRKSEPDTWCVGFRNEIGEDTQIRLSNDAMAALMQLYRKPLTGKDIFPAKLMTEWRVTTTKE